MLFVVGNEKGLQLGILAPDLRASLRAIATACFLLSTFLPLPDLSVPGLMIFHDLVDFALALGARVRMRRLRSHDSCPSLSRHSHGARRIVVWALIVRLVADLIWSCCNFGNPESRPVNFLHNFLNADDHSVPLARSCTSWAIIRARSSGWERCSGHDSYIAPAKSVCRYVAPQSTQVLKSGASRKIL